MGTVAVSFDTGEILWKQKIFYQSMNGAGGSPVVVDNLLVFTTDGFESPVVTALYLDTGKIAWRTERSHKVRNNFSFGTPLLISNQGETQIISPGSGMVGAYRPIDGKELWRVRYKMGYSMSTRPIFVENRLYMATGFGRPSLYAIRVDGATGDLTDTHVEWQYHKSMPKTPSPNFINGNIITLEDDGRLQCLNAETGEHQWVKPLKGKFSASPVQVGDLLYVISEEGLCYILKVNGDGCEILTESEMGEETLATPAIVDNTLYLRTHPHLWKIGR
jgi:outer membrane protein assembly factor BamB